MCLTPVETQSKLSGVSCNTAANNTHASRAKALMKALGAAKLESLRNELPSFLSLYSRKLNTLISST